MRTAVALSVLVRGKQMIYDGSCSIEGYQFEMRPYTEKLSFGQGTLFHIRIRFHQVDNQVCFVNDAVHARIQAGYHGMIRVEGIFVQLFHLGIVATRTTTAPHIVGQRIFGHEPIVVIAAPAEV